MFPALAGMFRAVRTVWAAAGIAVCGVTQVEASGQELEWA